MKKKLYEAGTEVIKIIVIYVFLMALIGAVSIGAAMPVIGVGMLVVATFINSLIRIKIHFGGEDHGSD